jgi:hypothetical protein
LTYGPQLGDRGLQAALLAAALAALAILVSLFGDPVRIGCLAVIVLATIVTAPQRRLRGGGWWTLLAAGAIASVVGFGLAELTETVGGLISVAGGVLVVGAATMGFPLAD